MIDGILGIDVSKNTLDVSISAAARCAPRALRIHLTDGTISWIGWSPRRSDEFTPVWNPPGAIVLASRLHCTRLVILSASSIPLSFETSCAPSWVETKLTGSMRRTFVSIVNCSSPCLGRRLRRRTVDWGSCRRFGAGIIAGLTEWKNRKNSGIVDAEAQSLADVTILHFTSQIGAVDKAIALAIENDSDLRPKRDLLLSISGVGETLAGVVLAELPGPDVLRSSGEVVAYAGLNPRQHQSGTSVDRVTRISKIGNAVLRAALYMPALSAMRYNPAIVALVTRLKSRGRLKPKQIVVAAMRKLLVLCFGVLKTGKPFDPAIAMGC